MDLSYFLCYTYKKIRSVILVLGACFSLSGIIFVTIFLVTFFSKSNIRTNETKLYGMLLIITFLGTFIDIFSFALFKLNFDINSFLYKLFAKSMLIYFIAWILIFTEYIYTISSKSILKLNYKFFRMIFIFFSLIVIVLNIDFSKTKNGIYPSGIGVNITYFLVALFLVFSLILTFENIKEKNKKKYIPIFVVILMLSIATLIQKVFPDSFLINFSLAIVVSVMYFTIENPDVKIIEEVYKAKVISDTANEEKSMFLYNMTNNIRSITKDINNKADNILNETDNKKIDIEVINDSARGIKGDAAKFTTMTNYVFDISSIDSSNIRVYNDKYNIKLLLKEINQRYRNKARDKGIEFISNTYNDIPTYLYGDSVGVKRVLSIILDNSIKYTNKGYIEFDVDTIIKNDIVRLIITIEDSGCGIDSEDIKNIFIKPSRDNGNNLYTAKKLITLMNGTIIPSSVYSGTTMKIILDQKYEMDKSNINKYNDVYDKKRILLIDDNESSCKLFKKIFNNTNIDIDSVKLGKEGLDKIRNKEKYDLILLDEDMSPLDGHEVMRKFRLIPGFNTRVILLTRTNKYEYDDEYKEDGFLDYIIKGSNKRIIIDKVNKYLR